MPKACHSNYYEAKLQIRPKDEAVIHFVIDEINKRKDVFIAKTEELKTGVDFYISSQRYTRTLGKKLKEKFKGELKVTKTLFKRDRQTSKVLYRGTVLFRLK